MDTIIISGDTRLSKLKITRASIFPFTERPDNERSGMANPGDKKINAVELFSFFTADIIKEKVIFTR